MRPEMPQCPVSPLPDFLVDHPDGEVRVRGTRISLQLLVSLFKEGRTPERIHEDYDHLPAPLIADVLAFYQAHREAVDAYIAAFEASLAPHRARIKEGPSREELRKRLDTKRKAEAR